MPFSIGLYFDHETEAVVRNIWRLLAEHDLADYYPASGNRPHITVRIFNDMNIEAAEKVLSQFSQSTKILSISFQQIGVFNGLVSTVFWAPVVTQQLLSVHSELEKNFHDIGAIPGLTYYAPGNWIPHCGLAMEINRRELVPQIVNICQDLPNPHVAKITEIGLIKFRPVEHLFNFSFSE